MKLRLRVITSLFLMVIPSVVFFTAWRIGAEKREFQSRLGSQIVARFAERVPDRCLRRPERFSIERRGMRAFAYDNTLVSMNPDAPPFPKELKAVLGSEEPISTVFWSGGVDGATAGRIAPDGPCAIILVGWGQAPPTGKFLRASILQALLFAVILVFTGFVVSICAWRSCV